MKAIKFISVFVFVMIFCSFIVLAITPQNNFNFRSYYNLSNIDTITMSSGFVSGSPICTVANGLCLTAFTESDPYYFSNPLGYYNVTTLPAYPTPDNSSWNQSLADTLYYSILNPYNYLNLTTIAPTHYNKTEIDVLLSTAGNSSWNQTLADTLYYSKTENINATGYNVTAEHLFFTSTEYIYANLFNDLILKSDDDIYLYPTDIVSVDGDILPATNMANDLGSTTLLWDNIYSDNICIEDDCIDSWNVVNGTYNETYNIWAYNQTEAGKALFVDVTGDTMTGNLNITTNITVNICTEYVQDNVWYKYCTPPTGEPFGQCRNFTSGVFIMTANFTKTMEDGIC